ncbi:hypothetical protein LC613_06335 [Nostoc sphaeroides CHAB 2801]|uniref:hypothetical protein n=1 Tax=Nostoc sphaeroides TaxID=446679 RepID=UPI001E5EC936|nr:hypothetical protein [Nostoc sphaeroides]MCC5627777.1 hypothetical protein [Nostoc sphaeroides CHAB 2801]
MTNLTKNPLLPFRSEEKIFPTHQTPVQIQQDFSQIGIKVDMQIVSFNVVLQKLLSRRDWDCYVGAFGVPGADVKPNLLSLFWTSFYKSKGRLG